MKFLLLLGISVAVAETETLALLGAGASFPANVYKTWIPAYKIFRKPFVSLDLKYDTKSSGVGKARIKGEKLPYVHFAGSDSLLTEEESNAYPDLKMFPTMAGLVIPLFVIEIYYTIILAFIRSQ